VNLLDDGRHNELTADLTYMTQMLSDRTERIRLGRRINPQAFWTFVGWSVG
jgi:hypothetical protein